MRIVITGGAGSSGASSPLRCSTRGTLTDAHGRERAIERIVLLDVAPAADLGDARVTSLAGDLADPTLIDRAFTGDTDSVFHLAAVVSGEAEANFDLGWRVNVDATRALLERCRTLRARRRKFVFTSSLAVFGGALPDLVPDDAGAHAAVVLRRAEGGRRAPRPRLRAQGLHRRAQPAAADGHRAPRQAEQGRVVVRERHHPRAAGRRRGDLPGRRRRRGCGCMSPRAVIENLIVGHEAPASAFPHVARSTCRASRSPSARWSTRCGASPATRSPIASCSGTDPGDRPHRARRGRATSTPKRRPLARHARRRRLRGDRPRSTSTTTCRARSRRRAMPPRWAPTTPAAASIRSRSARSSRATWCRSPASSSLDWSAANVLLLYFVDTMLSIGVIFAGLMSCASCRGSVEDRWASRAQRRSRATSRAPLFIVAFIAVPLGMPLVSSALWRAGTTSGPSSRDPALRRRARRMAGRRGRLVVRGALARAARPHARKSCASSAGSRSCSCAGS